MIMHLEGEGIVLTCKSIPLTVIGYSETLEDPITQYYIMCQCFYIRLSISVAEQYNWQQYLSVAEQYI